MCRRMQDLEAERQRAAEAERALQEAQAEAKAQAEELTAQLAEVRTPPAKIVGAQKLVPSFCVSVSYL